MADSQSVGKIHLDLGINSKNFSKSMSGIEGMAKKAAKTLAAAFAIKGITDFGKQCLDLGSDLTEVQNVVDTAFGPKVSKKVDKFAQSAATSFGLSETMAKRYAGTFGAMATAFGFSQDQAADMSTQLTGLAGDVASFYNISQDEAYTKLKSVFTGETESLKDLGVVMTQTALDSYAMANGFGKTTAKMSEAEKVALRYKFVQDQLNIASGDFAKTSGSWANQVRILSLQFDSLKASIGQGLINLFTPIIQQVNALMKKMVGLASIFKQFTEMLTGNKSKDDGIAATANMAADADSSMSGASAAASNLAKNTTAAGKAAKKAKKEMFGLASWDELSNNTSSKNSDSGSSSTGTGAAGGKTGTTGIVSGVTGKETEGLNKGLEKFKNLIDSIKTVLQPTIQAIKNLWEALKPLKDFTIQALLDFYNKFLKPVGKWVLGEGLPKFINVLADGLSRIDFSRINKALAGLWDALTPFTINIGKGLLWFWENVLVPLGTWTANEVVPRFLKTLSSVISILNTVIEGLKPLANWLWENFLQKLAKFTGKLFLKAWDGINAALSAFSNWLSDNKNVVSGMVITLTAFFAAWKTTMLLSFIQQSGGVVAALGKVAEALLATRLAKIKDVAETAILNAMYAKDFVVSMASSVTALAKQAAAFIASTAAKVADTAAQIAATAATVAWNAACALATAATTAFGVAIAILTSPITLVIAGLAALVVAGVAVYKNWDKIKAKAEELWKKIVAVFSPVGAWFKTKFKEAHDSIVKTFDGIKTTFENIWKNIQSAFSDVGEWFKTTFDKAVTGIKNAFLTISSFFGNVVSKIKGAFTGIGDWFKDTSESAYSKMKEGFSGVKSFFTGKCKDVQSAFTGIPDWFKTKFASAYNNASGAFAKVKDKFKEIRDHIKAPFKGIADWFESTFKGAWEKVKDVFSAGGKIFSGVKEGLEKTFKTVVNGLISGINIVVSKPFNAINKMLNTIRKVGVGKIKPFESLWEENPITVPKIPALAQGGYVKANTPQLAMIGDNRHYGEVVSPEDKLQAMAVEAGRLAAESTSAAMVPVIERLCNAIIALENTSGGVDLEKYKEGDLLRVVRNENTKYKKQYGVSALT